MIISGRFGMDFLTIYFNIWEGRCLPRNIKLSDVTFSPESTGQFFQGKFQGPGLNRYSKQEDGLFPGKTPQSPAQLFQNILEDKIEVSCLLTQNKDMDL